MPLQLGAGTATIDYTNPVTSKRVEVVRFGFLVTEISVAGHYKFFSLVGHWNRHRLPFYAYKRQTSEKSF